MALGIFGEYDFAETAHTLTQKKASASSSLNANAQARHWFKHGAFHTKSKAGRMLEGHTHRGTVLKKQELIFNRPAEPSAGDGG